MFTSTETMIKSLFIVNSKGGCFFIVEGAKAGMLTAPAHQLHTPPHHVSQADAGANFIDKLGRKCHLLTVTPDRSVRADRHEPDVLTVT